MVASALDKRFYFPQRDDSCAMLLCAMLLCAIAANGGQIDIRITDTL